MTSTSSTELTPEQLYTPCNPADLGFETTDELADIGIIIGQERALDAIQFGIGISRDGYNIFALGPPGAGKMTAVREIVSREAQLQSPPPDWCYVSNFSEPSKPRAISLPAGLGKRFSDDMALLVEELSGAIPATFEGDEYRSRAEVVEEQAKSKEFNAIHELRQEAAKHQINLIETPTGFAFLPVNANNEVMNPDQYEKLSDQELQTIQGNIARLHQQLEKILRQFPIWRKEAKAQLKSLNREFAAYCVSHLIADLREHYAEHNRVVEYLKEVEQDIVDHIEDFLPKADGAGALFGHGARPAPLLRYRINLLVDNGSNKTAPIIDEKLPSHTNLIGRVEYQAHMGTLVTDFTMIKPGALHLANGGYLILEAHKLLMQPFAWDSLKRALQSQEIRIESLERTLSLISTATLEPEPIPLRLKVILTGERMLYYLLNLYDPEFRDFFKVAADFADTMPRNADCIVQYAHLLGSLARRENLRPLANQAVCRIIEHGARLSDDAEKLTTQLRAINDLLKESDYWASKNAHTVITVEDVQTAIDQQIRRADRVREQLHEAVDRGTLFIATSGERVGQINGLSVIMLGDFSFGQPSRITATTRLGSGKILDIERETELGGAIHSKGVMILSSFLSSRYAPDAPFPVSASLVFEQSYGSVDGDSASLAELCALISSLSDLPIKQSLAVTGSINQLGQVQPIGGVNEKIEGFFDVCRMKGLSGDQGVIIPAANIKHLMLKRDVIDAVRNGQFHVYPVDHLDQALEILMQRTPGTRDDHGLYPPDSINGRLSICLERLRESAKKHSSRNNDKPA